MTDHTLTPTPPAVSGPGPASVPATWLMATGELLTDAIGILVPVFDSDGQVFDFAVRYANPAAATFAGRPVSALVGRRLLELAPRLRHIGLFDVLVSGWRRRTPVEREMPLAIPGRDDQRLILRARPVDDAMVVVAHDTTEPARRARQRDDRLDRLDLIGGITQDALWEWDIPADRLTIGSPLLGLPPGAPVAATSWWREGVHPDDRAAFDAMLQRLTSGESDSWAGTYRFRHADGSYRLVLDRRRVLRDVDRRPVHMIGTLSDLGEPASPAP